MASCDQCNFCTELCPRYLLGHPIEPHKNRRNSGFAATDWDLVAGAEFCCECNLCSLYACPEDLDPKNISTDLLKQIIKARIEEIIELAFLESNFLKNLNLSSKQKLIPYGGGSKLILHNYNFPFNHIFSEFITCDLSNPIVGAAGFQYHNTVESDFVKSKKKIKKQGFFENFFNLFSK